MHQWNALRTCRTWAHSRPWVVDGALAAVVTAVSVPFLWNTEGQAGLPGYGGPDALAVVAVLSMTVPLVWRRRAPLTVLGVVALGMIAAAAQSVPHPGLAVMIALYTVAAYSTRRRSVFAVAGMLVTVLVGLVLADALRFFAINAFVLATAWLVGDWRRIEWARTDALEQRTADLEERQAELERLAVRQEHERIAGELRDVLAHNVAAMVTQARAAERQLTSDAGRAASALTAVEEIGRAGLMELRRLVGLLRDDDDERLARAAATEQQVIPEEEVVPEQLVVPEQAVVHGRTADAGPARDRRGRVRRWLRSGPVLVQDVALAGAILGVELSVQWLLSPAEFAQAGLDAWTGPSVVSVLVVSGMGAALVFRRLRPQLVLAVIMALTLAAVVLAVPAQLFAPLVALYTVAVHCRRGVALLWAAGMIGSAAGVGMLQGGLGFVAHHAAIIGAAWALGHRGRVRRHYAAELERRAEELERSRARRAALAVAKERTRLARELHDVVTSSLGAMVVQAGGARRLLQRDPERAAGAVEQVVACGRETLVRLREVVDVSGETGAVFAPQPTLDDLPQLVGSFAETGLRVDLRVLGEPRSLSAGVALSAYRIVQESLTNVLKHALVGRADVTVSYHPDRVRLEILDDGGGRGPADGSGPVHDQEELTVEGGHGLVGMRERAALVGGSLEAGIRRGGGFRVAADLPTVEPRAERVLAREPAVL